MARSKFFTDKNKIFRLAEAGLENNFGEVNRSILNELLPVINSLDTTGGSIISSTNNTRILSELDDIINGAVQRSDYVPRIQGYLRNFDQITAINAEFHSNVNQLSNVSRSLTGLQTRARADTVRNLLGTNMNAAFVNPISDALGDYITSGTNITEVENNLRRFVLGGDGKLGKLERYVKQVGGDAIRQYDGQIQAVVQKDYQLNAVSYEGSLITDSRPQCVRWVEELGGVIMVTELQSQIEWAENNGSGMIEGTTPETFYINRGGYGCRHHATAINVE